MAILTPTIHNGPVTEARDLAIQKQEPVFRPVEVYMDDRGWSLMNLMQGVLDPAGQINISAVNPGVVKAWHRHQHQTDLWVCISGHIRVGVYRETDNTLWQIVTGERRAGVVIIPPTLWHGVGAVGPDGAQMFYYVTKAYDPANPDEERRAYDSVDGFQWGVEHR